MTTLQSEPFNLSIGQKIRAKVIAVNSVGDSPESDLTGEALSA